MRRARPRRPVSRIRNLNQEFLKPSTAMRLYVEPMNCTVVEVSTDGRLRYEGQTEWSEPTLQERRAVIYAARTEMESLTELIDALDPR
jgi:hypothetical protein